MIKVLHRAATTGFGGIEQFIINYYKYMDHDRIRFDILTRNKKLADEPAILQSGIRVRTFHNREYDDRNALMEEIRDIIRDYDVLHMNTSIWAGFGIEEMAMGMGIPKVIVHSHSSGIDWPDEEERKEKMKRHEYYKKKFSEKHATHLMACSNVAADWLYNETIPKEHVHIIHNAIDIEEYTFDEEVRKKKRAELGIEGNFVIGLVARFSYQKNHDFMLRVLKEFSLKHPETVLLFVGEGELELEMKKKVVNGGGKGSRKILGQMH